MDPKELTFEQKVAMFREIANPNGQARADYAASRADIILPLLETQSTIRSIFRPETLPPGADARYDIPFDDIECTIVMPQIGGIPTVQFEGSEMHVDTFGIDGGVEWQMDIARDGRFQVGQLGTTLLKNKFVQQEEICGWNLIKAHAATLLAGAQFVQARKDDGTTASVGQGKLNIATLNEVITAADELGVGGRRVTDIYVSPRRFGDLRAAVGAGLSLPDSIKTQLWSNGQGASTVADIRIHRVYNRDLLTLNGTEYAFAFTQKEGFTYGVMPVRETLSTRENPMAVLEWKVGIIGRERLGFGVLDDKGLMVLGF